MSSNQSLILDAIDSRITALSLGRDKLKYSYDLEKNDTRGEKNAYGYGASDGTSVAGTFKAVTMDQNFFIVLTENFVNRRGDAREETAIKTIYDDIEVIYQDFVSSKLGINDTVLLVSSITLDAPEKLSDNTISVRANFIVKHRQPTT